MSAAIAFSQLRKDRLVISKRGVGSFVAWPLKNISDLQIYFETYVCLFFRQNGEDGLLQ
jgi:DNA-binding GntR family transcriptional regulator